MPDTHRPTDFADALRVVRREEDVREHQRGGLRVDEEVVVLQRTSDPTAGRGLLRSFRVLRWFVRARGLDDFVLHEFSSSGLPRLGLRRLWDQCTATVWPGQREVRRFPLGGITFVFLSQPACTVPGRTAGIRGWSGRCAGMGAFISQTCRTEIPGGVARARSRSTHW